MTSALNDPWTHATTTAPVTSVPDIGTVTPAPQPAAPVLPAQPVNNGPKKRSANIDYGVPENNDPSLAISKLLGNYMILIPQDQCQEYTVNLGEGKTATKINALALILNSNPTYFTGQGFEPLEWENKPVQPGDVIPVSVLNTSIKRLLKTNYDQINLPPGSRKTVLRGKISKTKTKSGYNAVIFQAVDTPPADVIQNLTNPVIAAKITAFQDEYADFLYEPA